MIAFTKTNPTKAKPRTKSTRGRRTEAIPSWHVGYLKLLPDIYRLARIRTGHLRAERGAMPFRKSSQTLSSRMLDWQS